MSPQRGGSAWPAPHGAVREPKGIAPKADRTKAARQLVGGPTPRHRPLLPQHVDTVMMRQGGTILGTTNKGDPFAYPMPDGSRTDRSEEIIANFRDPGCDALIGVGGDGSLAILRRLAPQGGIPLICVPKTIDNDVGMTETAVVGFDTAVSFATEALDRLQPTAASHERIMVLEVMGRGAGHIALAAGIAGGADVIPVTEIPCDIRIVAAHLREIHRRGRNFGLVVVPEAVHTKEGGEVTCCMVATSAWVASAT